ncbi:MAG: hypothetical protein CUN54_09650, partial [Phototrophicales bacterium]
MTTAIYDGKCVLCNQTRRTVRLFDWFNRVEFLDLHDWETVSTRYPTLKYEDAMGQIHVVTADGQLIGGFWGMRRMMRDLPLGMPLWALLHLPGMNWLGPKLYNVIARNRYRINKFFGVDICEDGVCKVHL